MLTGLRAGAKGAAAAVLAAAALLAPGLTTSAQAADSAPCTPDPGYPGTYRCPIWGSNVNLRSAPHQQAPVIATSPDNGWLRVLCQVKGARADYGGYWHTWWVKTPAMGMAPSAYMSEIFLVGGRDDERDAGLPTC
ncbi:hypothetical protein [Streptomyces sp. NPDC047706]|uniref:hypothetical protein n=1 Tax=Streptomyces sp. NPDC047706 TaxID=3365486 RepID=UPI0037173BD0